MHVVTVFSVQVHNYVIQAKVGHKSWPLTAAQWVHVQKLQQLEKEDMKAFSSKTNSSSASLRSPVLVFEPFIFFDVHSVMKACVTTKSKDGASFENLLIFHAKMCFSSSLISQII